MSIPNVKRYRITSPDGAQTATLMAVLPKNIDVAAYLSDAAKRFDNVSDEAYSSRLRRPTRRSAQLTPFFTKLRSSLAARSMSVRHLTNSPSPIVLS